MRHVKEGDRVGVPWLYTACGHCKHCLGGSETLCEKQQNTGYSVNGSFAEYVVADPDYVGHLPANVSFVDIAPILCAGVTVYKALKVTDTRPNDWVVILGIGGLGHLAVQYANAMGLNVIAVDVDDTKLELARQLGAVLAVNAAKSDPVTFVKKEVGGAQGVLVTAVSPKAFEQAIGMVDRGGTVSLNGLPPGSFPLSIFDTVINGITIRGSIVGTRTRPAGSFDLRRRGQGQGDRRHGYPGKHQPHLYAHASRRHSGTHCHRLPGVAAGAQLPGDPCRPRTPRASRSRALDEELRANAHNSETDFYGHTPPADRCRGLAQITITRQCAR